MEEYERWRKSVYRKVNDDLFIAPFSRRSLLIYRSKGDPLRVQLTEVKALIGALEAAADALGNAPPRPPILPPTP